MTNSTFFPRHILKFSSCRKKQNMIKLLGQLNNAFIVTKRLPTLVFIPRKLHYGNLEDTDFLEIYLICLIPINMNELMNALRPCYVQGWNDRLFVCCNVVRSLYGQARLTQTTETLISNNIDWLKYKRLLLMFSILKLQNKAINIWRL